MNDREQRIAIDDETWLSWSECAYSGFAVLLRHCVKAIPNQAMEPIRFALLQCYIERIFFFMVMTARDKDWFAAKHQEYPTLDHEMEELHAWALGHNTNLTPEEIKEAQANIGDVMCAEGGPSYSKINSFVQYLFAPQPGAPHIVNKPMIVKAEEKKILSQSRLTDAKLCDEFREAAGVSTGESFIKHLQELRRTLKKYSITITVQ